MKGSESLKHEYNKQLLLELIIKRLKQDPKIYYSKHHMHSAIKLLIQDTMSRFKTMKSMYGAANFLDNYDRLYELVSGKEMDKSTVNQKEIEALKKGNKLDYKRYEALLMSKFVESLDEIISRQHQIEDIRRFNYQKSLLQEAQQQRFAAELENLKKEEQRIYDDNKKVNAKRSIRTVNKEALTLEDYMKITKIEHKVAEIKKKQIEDANSISDEMERNLAEVKRIENEITDLKMKRVIFKFRLKECYVNIVKKPMTTM